MKLSKLEWVAVAVAWVALGLAIVACRAHAAPLVSEAPYRATTPHEGVYGNHGDLYGFCDSDWKTTCDMEALMLKDVCEQSLQTYAAGDDRFWCVKATPFQRDAYMRKLEPAIREKTIEAWRQGR